MTPNPSNPTQTEDWVMVPADPNEAMLRAARDVPLNRHPGFSDFGSIYRAMLSAAPTISPRGSEDRETALREALDAYDTASAIARMTETRDAVRKQAEARTRLFALAALSPRGRGEGLDRDVVEALTIAEDTLSRFPFSSEIWPNGMHPNTGIGKIRDALAALSSAHVSGGEGQ